MRRYYVGTLGAALAKLATSDGVFNGLNQLHHVEGLTEQLKPMFLSECHALAATEIITTGILSALA